MSLLNDIASSIHSTKYRPDIDGLRAVAVSSVIICHAKPNWLPGGFIGVDIFFVISGYLISSIIIFDLEKDRFSLLSFYDRRIRRIFPALTIVLVATLVVGWFLLFRSELKTVGWHVGASALFSENFLLWSESGYFDISSKQKPLLHLWSLAIEEQFYILCPLFLYATRRSHVSFLSLFLIVGLLSFGNNLHDIQENPTAAYYSPLGRFWELMIGSCLAYLQIDKPGLLMRFKNAQSILGASLLATALIWTRPDRPFPGFWALLPTLGTFLLISAGQTSILNRTILSTQPLVWCGLISYPLYLWHWPILFYSRLLFQRGSHQTLLYVILAVILSALTFFFIERPFRTRSTGRAKPLTLLSIMVMVLCCGAGLAWNIIPYRHSHFDVPAKTEWDFLKAEFPSYRIDNIYPIAEGRPAMTLFIGDSQLAQYAEHIDKIVTADASKPGAIFAVGGGCIPIEGVSTTDPRRKDCWPLIEKAYRMAGDARFETIVIGGSWNWYMINSDYTIESNGTRLPVSKPEGRKEALARLEQKLTALRNSGKKVYLLLGNPIDEQFMPWRYMHPKDRLHDLAGEPNLMVDVPQSQLDLREALLAVAERAGVLVIDPFIAICVGGKCRASDETGLPVFTDASHFNPDWAAEGAKFIDVAVERSP